MTTDSVLFSTAYFPPVSWFSVFMAYDERFIEAYENYSKQSYRNRCIIYSANGAMPLIIPVTKTTGNHTLIKDIIIDYKQNWCVNHWRAIEAAYSRTPYFIHYNEALKSILFKKHHFLLDLNNELLLQLLKFLRTDNTDFYLTEKYVSHPVNDKRVAIHPKRFHFKNCAQQEYFQPFSHKHGFIKDLSIIDLLFNFGPDSKDYINRQSLFIRTSEYLTDTQS